MTNFSNEDIQGALFALGKHNRQYSIFFTTHETTPLMKLSAKNIVKINYYNYKVRVSSKVE